MGRPVRGSKANFVHPELAAAAAGGKERLNTNSKNKKENKSDRRKLEFCVIMNYLGSRLYNLARLERAVDIRTNLSNEIWNKWDEDGDGDEDEDEIEL